jgi:hypothetical protein
LNLINFVFELDGHLVYLGALHVQVVDLVAVYDYVVSPILIVLNKRIEHLMPLSKFRNNKLLQADDVMHVELGFDGV